MKLKKVLALTLSLVMMGTMPAVAYGSEFSDGSEEVFQEIFEGENTIDFTSDTVNFEEEMETGAEEISAATDSSAVSGQCGENVFWEIVDDTLRIRGTGDMYDYQRTTNELSSATVNTPWHGTNHITKVIVEEGITSIGKYAFYEGTSITSVSLPDSVKEIDDHAFHFCSSLMDVNIPEKVTRLGEYAFFFTRQTNKNIHIPSTVTEIGDCCFHSSGIASINIPESVTTIGDGLFGLCGNLANVRLSSATTRIEENAFFECFNLSELTIPNTVSFIGNNAFESSGLKKITFLGSKDQWNKIANIANVGLPSDCVVSYTVSTPVPSPVVTIAAPKITHAYNGIHGITLKWNSVPNVSGYNIYRKTGNGSYTRIASVKNATSYVDSGIKYNNGKSYTYRIRAYKGKNNSPYSYKTIFRVCTPSAPTLSAKSKAIVMKIKNDTRISGIEIQVSTDSKFQKNVIKKYASQNCKYYTCNNLKSGKIYYVRMRSFKKPNTYGGWSKTVSCKVK